VAEALAGMGLNKAILHLGLPDRFVEHGDPGVLLRRCGLDAAGIESAIGEFARHPPRQE
jgi:1-deoxy-D-xylulose-5-phosphate synthase